MEKENKKIVLSVIVGICLISMISTFGGILMVFRTKDVYSRDVWALGKTWPMIPILILSLLVVTFLSVVALKDFFGKRSFPNKTKLIILIITIVFMVALTVFFVLFLETMIYQVKNNGYNYYNSYYYYDSYYGSGLYDRIYYDSAIDSGKFTAYTQVFSSMISLLVPAIITTVILIVPVFKGMKRNKEANMLEQADATSSVQEQENI